MTVKEGLRRIIIKKTVLLLCIALILGLFCFLSSDHKGLPDHYNAHLIYTLISVALSLLLLIYIAYKIRYFHNLFAKEWTGTVVSVKRVFIRTYRARMNLGMDELIMVVRLDKSGRRVTLRLPYGKVGRVYVVGDRVHRLKGTRYPLNLTRGEQLHICPICGRDSCFGDECPDCNVKY